VFSVVVPIHNEEASLEALSKRLAAVMGQMEDPFEVIMVDDGSTDDSYAAMAEISRLDPRFRAVGLSRNFGHQVALTAGLELASGEAVITMDADLQHPPEVVPELIARWREGFDVVYGVMRSRASESRFKRTSSNTFYRMLGRLADVPMEPNAGDFRLVDRTVVDVLRRMPERNRYLRGMFAWVGFTQTGVDYACAPRHAGRSSYTLNRMMRLGVDAVISFSIAPLRLVLSLGLVASLLSVLVGQRKPPTSSSRRRDRCSPRAMYPHRRSASRPWSRRSCAGEPGPV
jgi:dolichol-phosphate mannosyltransferase